MALRGMQQTAPTDNENRVLRRIKEVQQNDSFQGKVSFSHFRSSPFDDLDIFEAEFANKKGVVSIPYERDEFSLEFTAPTLLKTLPEAVAQRLDSMEDLCFYGILSFDIHPLAWVSVDDSICLWIPPLTLAQPPPTRVVHFRDYVTAVALVRADPDKAYACDGVPPYFLAVALRDCVQLMQIFLTDTELVVRETGIEVAVDSFVCKMVATDSGRLFIGCKDGYVYEIDCTEADDTFGSFFSARKSRKTNCTKSAGNIATIWNVMKDVVTHAVRGPKAQDPVCFLVYDPSRHILLALTQARSVASGATPGASSNAQLHAFFLDSKGPQGELLCQRKPVCYKGPFSLMSDPTIAALDLSLREYYLEEIIALHPISKDESNRLNAVLVSSTGCRFYISVTEQDGFCCRGIRTPPGADQGGWAMPNAKSAKVTASAYQDGLWLATCAERTRSGGLFCISQDRFCISQDRNAMTKGYSKAEVVSSFPAAAVQMLPATVWALHETPVTYCFYTPTMYSAFDGSFRMLSTHELYGQHVTQHRKFLLLCRNGIFLVSRRQPWEKLDHSLARFPEWLSQPDKLHRALRLPKEQICATAVLWWVRSGVVREDAAIAASRPAAPLSEAQHRALHFFAACEKQEPGRGGLGLIIALSRFVRPVWWAGSAVMARDWGRVAGELDLVKAFIDLSGPFEVPSSKPPTERPADAIKKVEVVEMVSQCQQLCALLYLVVKGGGARPGGLGPVVQSYLLNVRGLGPDPILGLVRSVLEASCGGGGGGGKGKKERWSYEDGPGFRDNVLLSKAEQEQLDLLLTRLLPPSKLAQARADKELSAARRLHVAGESEGMRECVVRAQEQLMSVSRDLSGEDLMRYAGRAGHEAPSFALVKQPLPLIHLLLHRFANQSVVAAEEVRILWDFMQDMYRDWEESPKTEEELHAALRLIIQHAGLYRNAKYVTPAASGSMDRSGALGMQGWYGQGPQGGMSGAGGVSVHGYEAEGREERALWPMLRGMLLPHWRAYLEQREGSRAQDTRVSGDSRVSLGYWSTLVGLVGQWYIESGQAASKALVEVENFLRSGRTVEWLIGECGAQSSARADWFLSMCHAGLLHAAGLYAKAGQVCYMRAKHSGDASVEERMEALIDAKKAALLNGGQLPMPHVSVSTLELDLALAQVQVQLRRRSTDPSAEDKYGRALLDMRCLFEAACAEEAYDLALDICALSISPSEAPPAQVMETLWRNMLLQARDEGRVEEVMRVQGRKYASREGFFPLVHLIAVLEDEVFRPPHHALSPAHISLDGAGAAGRRSETAAGLLEEIGVEPLRLIEGYMARGEGRVDEAGQERVMASVSMVYERVLQQALDTRTEALLPTATIDNDFVRLETHPALRRYRHYLRPARDLLDRLRARLAAAGRP